MKSSVMTAIATMLILTGVTPVSAKYDDASSNHTAKVHRLFHANRKLAVKEDGSQELSGTKQPASDAGSLDYKTDNFIIGL